MISSVDTRTGLEPWMAGDSQTRVFFKVAIAPWAKNVYTNVIAIYFFCSRSALARTTAANPIIWTLTMMTWRRDSWTAS